MRGGYLCKNQKKPTHRVGHPEDEQKLGKIKYGVSLVAKMLGFGGRLL